jgi:hypothetical protein
MGMIIVEGLPQRAGVDLQKRMDNQIQFLEALSNAHTKNNPDSSGVQPPFLRGNYWTACRGKPTGLVSLNVLSWLTSERLGSRQKKGEEICCQRKSTADQVLQLKSSASAR